MVSGTRCNYTPSLSKLASRARHNRISPDTFNSYDNVRVLSFFRRLYCGFCFSLAPGLYCHLVTLPVLCDYRPCRPRLGGRRIVPSLSDHRTKLLTDVMICWVIETLNSSAQLYMNRESSPFSLQTALSPSPAHALSGRSPVISPSRATKIWFEHRITDEGNVPSHRSKISILLSKLRWRVRLRTCGLRPRSSLALPYDSRRDTTVYRISCRFLVPTNIMIPA